MLRIADVIKDQKFIDAQIEFHDKLSEEASHDYFILSWKKENKLIHIKNVERIKFVKPDDFIEIIKTENYNAVFIHQLFSLPIQYIIKIPYWIKVFWFSWGYDIYCSPYPSPLVPVKLYDVRTNFFLRQQKEKQEKVSLPKYFVKKMYNAYIKIFLRKRLDVNNNSEFYYKAIDRIDFFSGVFPCEYKIVKDRCHFKARPVEYKYLEPYDNKPLPKELPVLGDYILVGNSADPSNNHLDILELLPVLSTKQYIIPLSYGGTIDYVSTVTSSYISKFGPKCSILQDYMPKEEYFKVMNSVCVGVFPHHRQQAAGNIGNLIIRGAKVFLSENSINYMHYKSLGLIVFSIEKELNSESLCIPLTDEERWHNIKIFQSLSSIENNLRLLKNIYSLISC